MGSVPCHTGLCSLSKWVLFLVISGCAPCHTGFCSLSDRVVPLVILGSVPCQTGVPSVERHSLPLLFSRQQLRKLPTDGISGVPRQPRISAKRQPGFNRASKMMFSPHLVFPFLSVHILCVCDIRFVVVVVFGF